MNKFPKDFLWGAATAAYQIEGASDADGKGESIWDRFCMRPGNIADGTDGDMGCDHYHRYEEDIRLMKSLKIQAYRLSISWPRIFPSGYGEVNQAGVDFYKRVLECLKKEGIQASVTIYHWDLPQKLQDMGGWSNPLVIDYYVDYAEFLFRTFGDDVEMWTTFNEPYCIAMLGHWEGRQAPGIRDYKTALLVSHHLLLAHGRAVKRFRSLGMKRKIGIVLNMSGHYPADEKQEQKDAAERLHQANNAWFAEPIFKGTYPQEILDWYRRKGLMPEISKEEMEEIKQPMDFLGINHYFCVKDSYREGAFPLEAESRPWGTDFTEMGWGIYPQGFYDLLIRLNQDYGNIPIYITENGAAFRDMVTEGGRVPDGNRIEYLRRYLREVLHAIEDSVPVKGYFVWSFMDNFEWGLGFSRRFGLVHVDYETKKRTVKDSGYWYRDVIEANELTLTP